MATAIYQVSISADDDTNWPAELESLIESTALLVLEREDAPPCEVSIFITDDLGIQVLNKQYRDLDEPTDVLSFPMDDDESTPPGMPALLGDVIISLPRAREQANDYGHPLKREIAFLTVHGILHLLGYDHEEDNERALMREREESHLLALGLARELEP